MTTSSRITAKSRSSSAFNAASPEFAGVCASYGIKPGALNNLEWRDRNGKVTQFVARCYSCALERQGDKDGLARYDAALIAYPREILLAHTADMLASHVTESEVQG